MKMNDAIQKLIQCSDFEAVLIGEQFGWHAERYVSEIKELGFTRSEAEMGIAQYCNAVVADVESGKDVTFPHYREDLVKQIAEHCLAGIDASWRMAV